MRLESFRVQKYRSIIDSGWVRVERLTVMVGKNESGKTTLLKALHKLNPDTGERYVLSSEWPRSQRAERDPDQTVCSARFQFEDDELNELEALTGTRPPAATTVEVGRTYGGRLEVSLPTGLFSSRPTPEELDRIVDTELPMPDETASARFRQIAAECRDEIRALARAEASREIPGRGSDHVGRLVSASSPAETPESGVEARYVDAYATTLASLASTINRHPGTENRVRGLVERWLPTFIYMSEYRAFSGTAHLDQVRQRGPNWTEEDKTLLMLLQLAGLDLDREVEKAESGDREERQYDLDDASARLTAVIADRWKQRRYDVQFRADGHLFYTFVKDDQDRSLIRLEDRSKGFQWFFSFDLLFMHESQGTFRNCVLLLDEPGLHLHPDAQRELLDRLRHYADRNTLIYSTHLPFMIDVRTPSRIRVLNDGPAGPLVTEKLEESRIEARHVLEAALEVNSASSHLLARRNLIVEGLVDYWIIDALSDLLIRSGQEGLPDDLLVTPAGSVEAAAYLAAYQLGRKAKTIVLLDTDRTRESQREQFVTQWISRYPTQRPQVLSLGPTVGVPYKDFMIEDLFPDYYYGGIVEEAYAPELAKAGVRGLDVSGTPDRVCTRIELRLSSLGVDFDRLRVGRLLRTRIARLAGFGELSGKTQERARLLMAGLVHALGGRETPDTETRKPGA